MRNLSPPLTSNRSIPDAPDSPIILADWSPKPIALPFPSCKLPATSNFCVGLVVPIPTFPSDMMLNLAASLVSS